MVAALTRGKEGANWILAEVVAFSPSSGRYELDDVDEEQEKKKLILSKRRVVPLPTTRANPATHPDALHAVDTVGRMASCIFHSHILLVIITSSK